MEDNPAALSFWKRRRYLVIAGVGSFVVGIASGSFTLYVVHKLHHTEIVPETVHDSRGKYIYVNRHVVNKQVQDKIPVRVEKFVPELFRAPNLIGSVFLDPQRRGAIIDDIARRLWTGSDAYQIAQKAFMEPRVMVSLARTQNYNPDLLFRAAKLKEKFMKTKLSDELITVLKDCPTSKTLGKLMLLKERALRYASKKASVFEDYMLSVMPLGDLLGSPSEQHLVRKMVFTLSEMSEDPLCCVKMRSEGIVRLVTRIVKEVPLDMEDTRCLTKILANVTANAMDDFLVEEVSRSGLLQFLAAWSNSKDLDLCLRASKTLANLDKDADPYVYTSGVYLLHPLKLPKHEPVFDVVFVHGLRGGVLKTWRQNVKALADFQKNLPVTVDEPYMYTQCWPKDWLSLDFPSSRIIAVDYETSFVQSTFPSPGDAVRSSIMETRSADLLQRLKLAGIGNRPVFFISHSMGGILVKQLLLLASESPETQNILEKTLGCVFYSTPHLGSPFADQMARLFKVSPEVKDLRINNPYLLGLQEKFSHLVHSRSLNLLSFGETLPDYRIISTRFVPLDSSNPKLGKFIELNDATHFVSCKPENPRSQMYCELVQFLKELLVTYQDISVKPDKNM